MEERITALREKLTELDLDGIMINNLQNKYYLSGFTGTAGTVIITDQEAVLITDFRYIEQAENQAIDFKIIEHGNPKIETIREELQRLEVERLGFEAQQESYQQYQQYQKKLGSLELVPTKDVVKELRIIKDESELNTIQEAVKIADDAFLHITEYIEPEMTEKEVSLELEYFMKQKGASAKAFDFIVASGKRGAMPHGVATDKEIAAGELVTFDLGSVYQQYNSDLTRNIIVGSEPTEKQQEVYETVLEAQLAAIKAIEPGKTGTEIDKVARDVITKAGYGDNFGHGLGHGVGLEVHEGPRLAQGKDEELRPGMVVTVEPGIYLSGWGGIRIEDIVVVTEEGCNVITEAPKELIRV
ncbi:M24 family metallopeptidase [Acetohalobium arabaticum]|uniref:Peptidase M24 n=1 Tax=Acetohalobium arabaticum (strain ATCC 49924 / DSM 5501 / Z-7288) TaxID=574087 RepID=D9QRW8_ACEAZ|nr:Xaa-Pro peptidase family protein [Acetohalobium arabaticum]ADL13259.1 peptidase M24 [Acetohalobium arabaticum DSM 5501]